MSVVQLNSKPAEHEEIAEFRGVSDRTVKRDWQKARLMLYDELKGERIALPQ